MGVPENEDRLKKLYIEPASACNLKCRMCFRNNWIGEAAACMPEAVTGRVQAIAQESASIRQVMFSGMGEPLLHPEISTMVRAFSQRGITTELLTNGTLLNREKVTALLDAGLSMLWVSVDGFARSSYEAVHIGAQFDRISRNLAYFDSVRGACKLGITFVITAENEYELENINQFADRYHADCINLSCAVPCGAVTQTASCYERGYRIGRQYRFDPKLHVRPQTDLCPFIAENGCFIKWNGEVSPCMQLLHSSYSYLYEEKRKILAKSYGNIRERTLEEIWNEAQYVRFRQRVRQFAFSGCTLCMGCEDRLENVTDCMYNEFPTCGACLWAQGVARCP